MIRTLTVAAVALLSLLSAGTAAPAATADRTPPTAPLWGYAQGFYCLQVILGPISSTDNVTPLPQLRYEAYADGRFIGTLPFNVQAGNPWGVLLLPKTGPNWVTVRAVDTAGNRSAPGRAVLVTGYYTPGCIPQMLTQH